MQRQRREPPPGWPSLEGPELPVECAYVWTWFLEIAARRGSGMNGPEAITWHDIGSWSALQGITLTPFELECLGHLEGAFFKAREKKPQ